MSSLGAPSTNGKLCKVTISKYKLEKQKIMKSKYALQEGIPDICVSTDNFYAECAE